MKERIGYIPNNPKKDWSEIITSELLFVYNEPPNVPHAKVRIEVLEVEDKYDFERKGIR